MHLHFLSVFLSSVLAVPTAKSTADTPPKPTLSNVKVAGTACPQGSVSTTLYSDYLGTWFDSFSIYPGQSVAESRKTCVLYMDLTVAPEYAIRINEKGTDVSGYLVLPDEGYSAQFRITYIAGTNETGAVG